MNRMKPRDRRRGAVLIPFILGFGALAITSGMAVESALLLHARNKLFNDAESSVLAAANLYITGYYTQDALNSTIKVDYCQKNFLDPENTNLDFSKIDCDRLMILNTSKPISLPFIGKAITLKASMAATLPEPADHLRGVMPLAAVNCHCPFVFGKQYVLKQGVSEDNYIPLALGGSGADVMVNNIKYGYDGIVDVGDWLKMDTNVTAAIVEGISTRLSLNQDVLVPMIATTILLPEAEKILVDGFVAFRVQSVDNDGTLTGEFIKYKIAAPANPEAPDYGLYSKSRLVYY